MSRVVSYMESKKAKMDLCPNTDRKKFTFSWQLVNFSLCSIQRGKSIDSKPFTVVGLDTEWYLKLYPKGDATERFLSCYLCRRVSSGESEIITIDFAMSFLDCNGKPYIVREFYTQSFVQNDACGLVAFKRQNELFKLKTLLLPKDTLTVCCHIWNFDSEMPENVQCSAITCISAEKCAFTWYIKDFSTLEDQCRVHVNLPTTSKLSPVFEMSFYVAGGSTLGETGQIEICKISKNDNRSLASVCKISLLDVRGKVGDYAEDEYLFQPKGNPIWRFPPFIQSRTLMENKDSYLQNDILSLRCEFAISTGEVMDTCETIYGDITVGNTTASLEDSPKDPSFLIDHLEAAYVQKTCCDVLLRARNGKEFAHKLILCAWSPVFRAIFEENLKNRHHIIDVLDMDLNTLNTVLLFMYTEKLEALNWTKAIRLYSIASKYEIAGMKYKCLQFLKSNISVENVYEIMALAESCMDSELKTAAQEYISTHASEMLLSDEWKHFMRCKVEIASDDSLYMREEEYELKKSEISTS